MKKLSLFLTMVMLLSLCACGHTHVYTEKREAPTCTQPGWTKSVCECGDTITAELPATGHTEEGVPATGATCTEDGLTEGKKCSSCGEILLPQEVIASLGHSYGDWKVIKEPTLTETGMREKECSACGDKIKKELPVKDDPNAEEYNVIYDLDGGRFSGGYTSTTQLGEDFLSDFNRYGKTSATRENFQTDSSASVKVALSNAEMLAKWNWLWTYMLEHLKEYNEGKTSDYITDTYPILERMIQGDTTAIEVSANARTSIRSYLHGLLNSMKGCGDLNTTFATYSPDFSSASVQEKLLEHQYNLQETLANGASLPVPVRDGYRFTGWENKYGVIVDKAMCHGVLIALWEEINPVQKIEIGNKVGEIEVQSTYQLKWVITPADAGNQRVRFETSDASVATIDENGLITTYQVGRVTFKVISLSEKGCTATMTVQVVTPEYFDISYETNSYVTVGDEIKLNATYVDRNGREHGVTWKSLDEAVATVDENGHVTGLTAGVVKIRASVQDHSDRYQDFVVTVVSQDVSEALDLVLRSHESNIFIRHDLPVGSGSPSYYKDIFGSVSRLLYGKELEIDYTYNQRTNDKYGSDLPGRLMKSIEFIVVHYTGNFNTGADGRAHGEWFSEPKSENNTSIHYSTGNDGVFKGLDEQYRAAHAGDDGSRNTVPEFSWIDTPVEVLDTDPEIPVVTITKDATFAINGRDTGVKVPKETKYGRGYVTDSKWLNEQGIGVNVKDGKYQIGTSWWCYTQVGEGRICSNGGNRNSIGIESAVNKGSDLWYTWQITAQLVADIMVRQDLDITRVKGHHFFSAKDCPQPMLENDMEIWWEFLELVRAEYDKITLCQDYEFFFECDDELVNEYGRVTGQAAHSRVVTYKVTIEKDGKIETIELASIIEGSYNK